MARRKRIKIRTTGKEVIDMSRPHRYLVRKMVLGEVSDQVETDDIKAARKEYNSIFPPNEARSPSLLVDGKELLWDCEVYLMQADGDRQVPIKPRTEKKPPKPVKVRQAPGAYAMYRKYARKEVVFINRLAYELLGGCSFVRMEINPDDRSVTVMAAGEGKRLINSGSGREISAMAALNGLDVLPGLRYPVEPCDGGIKFRYREGYRESAG